MGLYVHVYIKTIFLLFWEQYSLPLTSIYKQLERFDTILGSYLLNRNLSLKGNSYVSETI